MWDLNLVETASLLTEECKQDLLCGTLKSQTILSQPMGRINSEISFGVIIDFIENPDEERQEGSVERHWLQFKNNLYKTKRYSSKCKQPDCSGCIYCAEFDFNTLFEEFFMWCFQHSNPNPMKNTKNHRKNNNNSQRNNQQRRFHWTMIKNQKAVLKIKLSIPTTWPQDSNADFYFSVGAFCVVGTMKEVLMFIEDLQKKGKIFENYLHIDYLLWNFMWSKK